MLLVFSPLEFCSSFEICLFTQISNSTFLLKIIFQSSIVTGFQLVKQNQFAKICGCSTFFLGGGGGGNLQFIL